MPLFQHSNFLAFHTSQKQSFSHQIYDRYFNPLRNALTVASANLSAWTSQLRSLFPSSHAQQFPDTLAAKFSSLLSSSPAAAYTTLALTALTLLYLGAKYLMSYAGSYRSDIGRMPPGRQSPYTSYHASRTGNISDYVEYIPSTYTAAYHPEDYHNNYHRPSVARPHAHPVEAEDSPDVLNLRYKGSVYELLFIPYAISDGKLYIQDVRFFAAEKLRTSAARIQMSYKGERLTHDSWQAKDYGLKQNSEITVVVTEADAVSVDSYSGSEEDGGSAVSSNREHGHRRQHHHHQPSVSQQPRPRGQSTARPRPEIVIPDATQASYLHPSSATAGIPRPSRQTERTSGDSLNTPSDSRPSRHDRAPSRSRNPSPAPHVRRQSPPPPATSTASAAAPTPTASSLPIIPPPASNSSSDRLDHLILTFEQKWKGPCERFIASPPSDPAAREKEYKLLSESVMREIVLQADGIESGGDPKLRKLRKGLVDDANALLKRLDARGKA